MIQVYQNIEVFTASTGGKGMHLRANATFGGRQVAGCGADMLLMFVGRLAASPLPEGWEWFVFFDDGGLCALPVHESGHGARITGYNGNTTIVEVDGVKWPLQGVPK